MKDAIKFSKKLFCYNQLQCPIIPEAIACTTHSVHYTAQLHSIRLIFLRIISLFFSCIISNASLHVQHCIIFEEKFHILNHTYAMTYTTPTILKVFPKLPQNFSCVRNRMPPSYPRDS